MLNDVLSIIDRLISLRKYRNERFRAKFKELCDPIFHDLLLVHTDYVKMFEGIYVKIRKAFEQEPFSQVIEILRERRVELEAVREKLSMLARELSTDASKEPAEVQRFFFAVSQYLNLETSLLPACTRSTRASILLWRLESIGPDWGTELSWDEMSEWKKAIEDSLSCIREDWSRVCEAYAQLTVSAISKA
jgi:hypothetical protein